MHTFTRREKHGDVHNNPVNASHTITTLLSIKCPCHWYRWFKGQRCQLVTLCHPGLSYIFNFWHSGTLALTAEHQTARMSQTKNGQLDFYGAEHSKCNHMMTLGFKGLMHHSLNFTYTYTRHASALRLTLTRVNCPFHTNWITPMTLF